MGLELVGVATSAIDVSDGLLKDIGHITRMSKVGAVINYNDIPVRENYNRSGAKRRYRHFCCLAERTTK